MTRIASPEQHEEARDLGDQLHKLLAPWVAERFPAFADGDDPKQVAARRLGWALLMTTLVAASARHDNKLWIIEGFGVALGQVMAAQTDDVEEMILECLDCGIEAGSADGDDGMRPVGNA